MDNETNVKRRINTLKKVLIIRTNKVDPDPRVEKEAAALCKLDWLDVTVLAWNRGEKHPCKKEELRLPNKVIPIYRFGIPAQWGNGMRSNIKPAVIYEVKLLFWLLRHIREYDCVHACDLMTGLPALLPVKLFRKKIVYDCCDYYADSQHGPRLIMQMLRNLETWVIEHSDTTILCSEKRMEQIAPACPKAVVYIHNSPDMDAFCVKEGDRICQSSSSRLKLAYVGNFCKDRWILELLENVAQIPETAEIHIGGMGVFDSEIKAMADRYENIYYYGKLPYKDVLRLERECDCLAALYETHIRNHIFAAPNKFYEALALGKPLLMLKNSGMSEIVEKERLGAIMEPTGSSLKAALTEIQVLLNEDGTRKERMKKLFEERYSWRIMEKRLVELYTQILEK